jgi:hypothetical protein
MSLDSLFPLSRSLVDISSTPTFLDLFRNVRGKQEKEGRYGKRAAEKMMV